MMIDDDILKQLLRINDELMQLCKFLNENATWQLHLAFTTRGRPNPHSDRSGQEQIALKGDGAAIQGILLEGSALMVHPFGPEWYVGGSVLVSGHHGSIFGMTRFQFQRFTVSIKELTEWFGLEIARLVVEECLARWQS
jgi:hypothetical protein